MFIIYVTMATKILNHQLIYLKNVINKAIYLRSGKVRLNNSYKFKIISIEFTSAKIKAIFGSIYVTMAANAKWSAAVLKTF